MLCGHGVPPKLWGDFWVLKTKKFDGLEFFDFKGRAFHMGGLTNKGCEGGIQL